MRWEGPTVDNCGIYAITSPSGKGYVGSSVRLPKRKTRHFYELRNNSHHCEPLQRAWNKYNGQGFTFVVLEFCSKQQLIEREQFWLDHSIFRDLYNINTQAGNPVEISPAVRAKISAATKGKPKSEETKARMRKPKSAAHAAAISAAKRGKPYTYAPEHLAKKQTAIKIAQEAMRVKRARLKAMR